MRNRCAVVAFASDQTERRQSGLCSDLFCLLCVSGTFLRSVKPADLEENRPGHVVTLLGDVTDACPGRRQMAELEADADNDISDY